MPDRAEDPDQATIELRAAEIRRNWSDTQRLSRAVGPVAGWVAPLWPGIEDDADERGWN